MKKNKQTDLTLTLTLKVFRRFLRPPSTPPSWAVGFIYHRRFRARFRFPLLPGASLRDHRPFFRRPLCKLTYPHNTSGRPPLVFDHPLHPAKMSLNLTGRMRMVRRVGVLMTPMSHDGKQPANRTSPNPKSQTTSGLWDSSQVHETSLVRPLTDL